MMKKSLPFVVPKRVPLSECVACGAVLPTEQLARCLCGSPICDCGIQCPDCVELFEVYLTNLSDYRASHLHLLGEDDPHDFKWLAADQAKIVHAFKNFGWLN